MELQFEKKPCPYLRRMVWDVKEQEQTQEVRLADGLPDIGTILGVWGQCVMRGKEWGNDSISTNGGVMAWALYAPADGSEPRMVECWLPIQMKWNMVGSEKMGTIRCHWQLKGVDGRTLSARKLMLRANVSILSEALEPWQEEVAVASEVPEDVQLLRKTYPARLPVEAGEKAFLLEDEIAFSTGEPVMQRLISCAMTPQITEQKVLGGKAVLRGNGNFHMLYQDTEGRLHSRDHQIGFSQLADLDRDYDTDAELGVVMALSSLEPELQEGHLRIKCGMVAQYLVSDQLMLELTEDAYSPSRQVSPDMQELRLPVVLDQRQEPVRVSCAMDGKCAEAVDVSMNMEQPAVRRAGDLTELICNGQAQVLYYDENGDLQGRSGRWSGQWELPVSLDADVMGMVQTVSVPEITVGSDRMEVGATLQMEACTVSQQPLAMVTALQLGAVTQPDPGRPSLILRRAGEGSLWEIAKLTGSTVSAIRSANGLTGEPVDDRLLLIPVV